jgi:hypothetical protein
MSVKIVDRVGDVKIFGTGSLGGKGAGLVKINECSIPKAHKLSTRVLTTTFFDRFIERGGKFEEEEFSIITTILKNLGDIPISVRSSATNEAIASDDEGGSVHAGENTSFMLPNNHPDFSARFSQLIQAIYHIYNDFIQNQPPGSPEKMGIVINPIPGIHDHTFAGDVYYPLVSGVANSFFPYALKTQNPEEGFARIAFGHGYATVLDDFPVISMATIQNPLPLKMLGERQRFFYAIDMTKNQTLRGDELETMKKLNVTFAEVSHTQIVGRAKNALNFEPLVENDLYGFKSGLLEIMEVISSKISSHYQIEFVFNVKNLKEQKGSGTFHVVQLTQLPALKFEKVQIPDHVSKTYILTSNFQGHGIKKGIQFAVVVSPFLYLKERHDELRKELSALNRSLREADTPYIMIVPGRLGSNNRDWGIQVDYRDVDAAAAIFEYGVDVAGRDEPLKEPDRSTGGGIYGSHFLYMIQGGYDEEQKRIQTRIYGTQGTHFLTNLMSNNIIYGFIQPASDIFDPWLFSPPKGSSLLYRVRFPKSVSVYADPAKQKCVVISEKA